MRRIGSMPPHCLLYARGEFTHTSPSASRRYYTATGQVQVGESMFVQAAKRVRPFRRQIDATIRRCRSREKHVLFGDESMDGGIQFRIEFCHFRFHWSNYCFQEGCQEAAGSCHRADSDGISQEDGQTQSLREIRRRTGSHKTGLSYRRENRTSQSQIGLRRAWPLPRTRATWVPGSGGPGMPSLPQDS